VAIECEIFELDHVTISIGPTTWGPTTLYKMALEGVTMRNTASSGLNLICSNRMVLSMDPEIRVMGVMCQ
jgi:hypothetical protein